MSTRHIKKVYGNDVIFENDDDTSDTELSATNNAKSKSFNVFNVLNESFENDVEDIIDKEDDKKDDVDSISSDMKRKKKKKRKNKKSENVKGQQQQDVCNENADEIERSIWEVNQLLGEPVPSSSNQVFEAQWVTEAFKEKTLTVQQQHLNPYNELKKIFGSKTIQAEQSKIKGKGRFTYTKKTWLVTPLHNWPSIDKSGLSMLMDRSINSTEDVQYFVYHHNASYKKIQLQFLHAVESSNPENIIAIINTYPYHVDGLLQTAEICRLNENLSMAADCIERALYSLETAFHSAFNLASGQCRLDYRKQQNRGLFIALFKHIGFVSGRACYRTCLEFCKLLLSLDPQGDPLAVVLLIDYYALRAKEYEWFINFCNLWENSRNLSQLPNIAYNLAFAHFRSGNKADADQLLQNALIMFPGLLMMLIDKCNIKSDWKVTKHNFFNSKAESSTLPALKKLQELYVVRNSCFWKTTEVLPWLEECVHTVLDRIESNDDYVKYCEVKRSKRYQGKLPRNILRHIILSDMKEVTINPEEIRNEEPILSHDPFPPVDSINIYRRFVENERSAQRSSNLLSLFFASLFTDNNGETIAFALDDLNFIEQQNANNNTE